VRSSDVSATVAAPLAEISSLDGMSLRGKTQTAIYRGSRPFLHFHWNDEGLVADVRYAADWERVPVDTTPQQRRLVSDVKTFLAS
jgi:hypothetical protein